MFFAINSSPLLDANKYFGKLPIVSSVFKMYK